MAVDISGIRIKVTVYDFEEALQSFNSYTLPNTPFYFSIVWDIPSKKNFFSNKEIAWDFGDGNYAYGSKVSHWYKWPGKYRAKAILTDIGGDPVEIYVESMLTVENVMPDVVSFENFVDTKNVIYKFPAGRRSAPLKFYRFNSWQNDRVLSDKNYTINLYASGGKSNYVSVSSYYESKWSHLKPYFGFVEYKIGENNLIKQRIADSTTTTSVSVYAEKYFDNNAPQNTKWNVKLRYHSNQVPNSEFCGTSGELPPNTAVYFLDQKHCNADDLTDVIFLYAYPDSRDLTDIDTLKYEFNMGDFPNGFINYPWNTKVVKTTFNPASALRFSSNGITVDGPNIVIGPLTGQNLYSFDLYPLKWVSAKIPFVITYADGENYILKNYPQIKSFTTAPTAPSTLNTINVFLMEYTAQTNGQVALTGTPEQKATLVNPKDYVIYKSEEVPHFETGCYFAGVLSANREIPFAYLSAIALIQDPPPSFNYSGYVYILQPGWKAFRRYEREFVFDHTNEEKLAINFKDILTTYSCPGSGGINITYAPLTTYGRDTKDFVWITDADSDSIYVFDQNGVPIENGYESNRIQSGFTNRINTGKFKYVKPGKIAPEPGFINARGIVNADKISSSPSQIAINRAGDAWISLYDSVSSFKFNKDNFYATAVAVPNVIDPLTPKILDFIDAEFNAAYNEFINKNTLPYTRVLSYAQSGINNFTTIIRQGPDFAPKTSPGGPTNSIRQDTKDIIASKRSTIQSNVIKYVDGTFFNVLTSSSLSGKCFRDSGYIIDAIAADIDNNTNHRSIDVGLIYFSGPTYETTGGSTVPTLPNNQIYATAAAISSIGPLIAAELPYSYYSLDEQFLLSGFDAIESIVGNKNNAQKTFPQGIVTDSTFTDASNDILAQRSNIQQKVIEFVKTNFPLALSSTDIGGSDALSAKCFRDTGFIVDSIAADIANNANHRSIETGIFYLSGAVLGPALSGTTIPTLPSSQVEGTIAAISAIGSFITGLTIPATIGVGLYGALSSSKYFTDSQNKLISSFNNFVTVIDDINKTPKTKPNGIITDFTFLSATDLIKKYKTDLQKRTVEFVIASYPYALSGAGTGSSEALSAKCFRDSGFIIDSLIADIENNANHRSIETGVFYFSGAVLSRAFNYGTTVPTLPEDQVIATIAAISAIGSFVTGLTMPPEKSYTTRGILSTNIFLTNTQLKAIDLVETFTQTIKQPLSVLIPPGLQEAPIVTIVPTPRVYFYTSFGANPPTFFPQNFYPSLYIYEGRNVAFFIDNNFFNPFQYQKMLNLVNVFDNSFDLLEFYTNDIPQPLEATTYNTKTIIAAVSSTCSENGCAKYGSTGVEINRVKWNSYYVDNLINNNNNIFDFILFYELSKNFWYFNNKLQTPNLQFMPDAFANFMGITMLEKLGLSGAPINGITPYSVFLSTLVGMLTTYSSGPYNWDNTFKINEGVSNALGLSGASYLMASILLDLKSRYGEIFVDSIWRKIGGGNTALTDQDVVDNFVLGCCDSVNLNLVSLFTDVYRWPVSDKVRELVKFYPTSKSLLVYPTVYPITVNRSESRISIQKFKQSIQQQVVEYVRSAFPYALSGALPGSSEALSAKCFRDAGYIIDAISDDIYYGVNYRSIETGIVYFSGAVISGVLTNNSPVPTLPENQVFSTIAAITAIGAYITGIDMPQIPAPFTTTGVLSTSRTSAEKNNVLSRIDNLTYPLKNNGDRQSYSPAPSASQEEKDLALIIKNNKTNIQFAVSSYVLEKEYLTLSPLTSAELYGKCNRDVGFMVDAVANDLENGLNAKSLTYSLAYWDGSNSRIPDELIPNQRANTLDVIQQLKSVILSVAVNNSKNNENLAIKKVSNLIYTMAYPLNNNGNTLSYIPSGSPTQKDILLSNLLIQNKTNIQRSVSAYVLTKNYLTTNPATSAELTAKCNRDVGYMIDAVASDLKTGVDAKSIQYAVAYWDGSTSRLPEDQIPNQKINTIDTVKVLQSFALDVAVENSDASENQAIKKIRTLVNTVNYPIKTGGASLSYDPPGLPLTTTRARIANVLLANKSTLQAKVSAYVTGNKYLTAGTVFSEKCTRDAGFMIDAVASDLLNGVISKSIQYGLAYWDGSTTRLPGNIIFNQIGKTKDTVKFLKTQSLGLYVESISATNQIVSDLFKLAKVVAYPLQNNGKAVAYTPAGEPLTRAREDAYKRLVKNRSKIQTLVKEFVDATIPLSPLFSQKCNRDVGLMVDAIASDIFTGVMSRTIQYALAYWEGSVSRLTSAVPDQNELTAQVVEYLGTIIFAIINEVIDYPELNRELFGGPGDEYDTNFGFTGENTILPTSLDVDKNDNVFIAYSHPTNCFIVKYNNIGKQQAIIALPPFSTPQQILIDLNNDIWVTVINNNSIDDEEDPQLAQMPQIVSNRNDYVYYFKSDFTNSFRQEFPLVGDLTMDRNGYVWLNYGINELARMQNDGSFKTFLIGNPASNTSYVQDFGGLAGDINGFLWVINNGESKIQLFDTDNPKSRTTREMPGFVLPQVTRLLPPESQNSYFYTVGDFSGIRWLLKNRPTNTQAPPRPIQGCSTLFSVNKPSAYIVKKNENFDLNEKIKSYVLQERLREKSDILFGEFTNALLNGDDRTTNELGKVIYERISNYVNNHSDIDLCTLQSLESLYQQLGFSYKKYFSMLPVNVRRIFDLLTINHSKLFGSTNKFNRSFTLSSYSANEFNNLGRELSIAKDTFIVGHPIIAYELFSGKYNLITNTLIPETSAYYGQPYPLSGVKYNWGWGLVVGSREQVGVEIGEYYRFYEYKPTIRDHEIFDNLIDFNDNLTTITNYNSSYRDWIKYGGFMDATISSMLYDGLELY